jgi:hypothetical protein
MHINGGGFATYPKKMPFISNLFMKISYRYAFVPGG